MSKVIPPIIQRVVLFNATVVADFLFLVIFNVFQIFPSFSRKEQVSKKLFCVHQSLLVIFFSNFLFVFFGILKTPPHIMGIWLIEPPKESYLLASLSFGNPVQWLSGSAGSKTSDGPSANITILSNSKSMKISFQKCKYPYPEMGPITIFMILDQITITWKNVITLCKKKCSDQLGNKFTKETIFNIWRNEKYFSDLLIYQLFGYNLAKIQLTSS